MEASHPSTEKVEVAEAETYQHEDMEKRRVYSQGHASEDEETRQSFAHLDEKKILRKVKTESDPAELVVEATLTKRRWISASSRCWLLYTYSLSLTVRESIRHSTYSGELYLRSSRWQHR